MIIATLQTYNEQGPDGKPYKKEFKNEAEMRAWLRSQIGHPWLSVRLLKTEVKK